MAFAFSPFFEYHCRLASFKGLGTGSVRQALGQPILHPVSISYEVSPVAAKGQTASGNPASWYHLRTHRSALAFKRLERDRQSKIALGSTLETIRGQKHITVIHSDAAAAKIPPCSVDSVVTDPPYFDRVHYDDLAGPLNAWMGWCGASTPSKGFGAQSVDRDTFSKALHACFEMCCVALKPQGRILFTYHHQDIDAWVALAEALRPLPLVGDGLVLIPGEMPNALVKQRARTPISHDAVLCLTKGKKRGTPKAAVRRAVRIARSAMKGSKKLLFGDKLSAAYAAATLVYLRIDSKALTARDMLMQVRRELGL